MNITCEYCHAGTEAGQTTCKNCGAPVPAFDSTADLHICPYCARKLLALGSPSCSYCGKRLPEDFIKAREATLSRVTILTNPLPNGHPDNKIAETIEALTRVETRTTRRSHTSVSDILFDITDIFS
ncbi:MAG TPA: hypothetical protein VJX67_23735 [Blastocatellia bacterium]|nr:hypothetical protein [Blastocatellia bacterium]